MVYAQTRICPKDRNLLNYMVFGDTSRSSELLLICKKRRKKETELAEYRSSRSQRENQRERKDRQILGPCQLRNMKVTVIPVVNGELGTVPKCWKCWKSDDLKLSLKMRRIKFCRILR